MFWSKKCNCEDERQNYLADIESMKAEIENLERCRVKAERDLSNERIKANETLKKIQQDHKIVVEDIKHMQRMVEEKNQLEVDRRIFEAEKASEKEIKSIRKEYADKLEKELLSERKQMQEFMQRVMDALPNINAKIKLT